MASVRRNPERWGYRDATLALRVLTVSIAAQATAQAGSFLVQQGSWQSLATGIPAWPKLSHVTMGANVITSWVMVFAFVYWVRQIVINTHALPTSTVTRSPWAGTWLLVPIANLVMPYLVLRDLWHATHDGRSPVVPKSPPMPPLVLACWATSIGATTWTCLAPVGLSKFLVDLPISPAAIALPISTVYLFLLYCVAAAITSHQVEQRHVNDVAPEDLPPRRAEN